MTYLIKMSKKLITVEGTIEEISNGELLVHKKQYREFIKIDGKRYRRIYHTDYMENFLKVGEKVKLRLFQNQRFPHKEYLLIAIKRSDGEVIKEEIPMVGYIFKAIPSIFFGFLSGAILAILLSMGKEATITIGVILSIAMSYGFWKFTPFATLKKGIKEFS